MDRRKFLEKFVALSSASLVLGESAIAEAVVVYGPPPMEPEPEKLPVVKPHWEAFPQKLDDSSVIRDDVEYIELRKYIFDAKTDKQLSDKYLPYISIYTKSLSSYPSKRVSKFQKISFGDTASPIITEIPSSSPLYKFKVKGSIIKKDGSFWTINEPKDIGWIFNGIDTPSKLYCFLKIYGLDSANNSSNNFVKTPEGYDISNLVVEHKSDGKSEYNLYIQNIYHIKTDGEFTKELVSSIKRDEKRVKYDESIIDGTALHPHPVLKSPPTVEEMLQGKIFTYPLKKLNPLESEIKNGS